MTPNLKYKAIFILALILFCIYFLVGYPTFPTSAAQIKDNFAHQIKLGLDLQGGTHLILQVQVQEAIAQETDQTVDRLTAALRAKNIPYDEVRRLGPLSGLGGFGGGGAGNGGFNFRIDGDF